jgi:hypothetical protein
MLSLQINLESIIMFAKLSLPLHEYDMSPHLFWPFMKHGFSNSDISILKHDYKAHSEAKFKYVSLFFSGEPYKST